MDITSEWLPPAFLDVYRNEIMRAIASGLSRSEEVFHLQLRSTLSLSDEPLAACVPLPDRTTRVQVVALRLKTLRHRNHPDRQGCQVEVADDENLPIVYAHVVELRRAIRSGEDFREALKAIA